MNYTKREITEFTKKRFDKDISSLLTTENSIDAQKKYFNLSERLYHLCKEGFNTRKYDTIMLEDVIPYIKKLMSGE